MTANAGEGSMSPIYLIEFAGAGVPSPECAVGKKRADGTRFLYTNIGKFIRKYVIDFTAYDDGYPDMIVTANPYTTIYSFTQTTHITEMELSPDDNKLAIATQVTNTTYLIKLDNSGDYDGVQTFSVGNQIPYSDHTSGVEFSKNSKKLFINFDHLSTCVNLSDEGIYVADLDAGTVSSAPIPNSGNYSRSHLELAYDGYIYAGGYLVTNEVGENRLARINASSEAIVGEYVLPDILPYFGEYQGYKCNIGFFGNFTLPNQIDEGMTVPSNEPTPLKNIIAIYPNPASKFVTISIPEYFSEEYCDAQIIDNLGRQVKKFKIQGNRGNIEVEVADLLPGIYQVLLQYNNNMYTGRFVKT